MIEFDDIKPFAEGLTVDQARIVIDDVEAELERVAPTLVDTDSPQVVRILRAAALRYNEYLKAGGRRLTSRQRTRGPFDSRDEMAPTVSGAAIFTVSEIDLLNAAADVTTDTPRISAPVYSFPCSESRWL
jgi:hypothetical protein